MYLPLNIIVPIFLTANGGDYERNYSAVSQLIGAEDGRLREDQRDR